MKIYPKLPHVVDSAHVAALYRRYCDRIVTPFCDRYVHYSALLRQYEPILRTITHIFVAFQFLNIPALYVNFSYIEKFAFQ